MNVDIFFMLVLYTTKCWVKIFFVRLNNIVTSLDRIKANLKEYMSLSIYHKEFAFFSLAFLKELRYLYVFLTTSLLLLIIFA